MGLAKQFAASGTYSDGTSHDITTQVTWSSSATSVATVNSSGLATSVAVGTATITATSGSISGSTTLTVTPATLSSISVTPANLSMPVGLIKQFTATGTYSDSTSHDITTQVTWSLSNTGVATITNNGLATLVAVGSTTVMATSGTITGSTTLSVTPAILSSITVTPANPSIPVAVTQQISATGTYSDSTSNDITSQVTWSSSNGSVATVNSSGLATGVTVGTVTITAISGSISGNTTLTVTSATLVGGIINTSTTWSVANSPYTLTSDVQIAYGATLTIQPGVRIFGQNYAITTWGTLSAVGTNSSKIIFNNAGLLPGANTSAEPFTINIQYSEIKGGSFYPPTGNAIYGSVSLTDSVVMDTATSSIIYVWYPLANCYFERNIFVRAGGISIGTNNGIQVYVLNNVFYQQLATGYGAFAVENWASYDTSNTVVEKNSFLSTDRIALSLPVCYSTAGMTAINNFWNTTNTSVIDTMIFDKNDNLGCAGYIVYNPILTAPDPSTPDPSPYIP